MRLVTLNLFHGGVPPGLRERPSRIAARLSLVVDELRRLEPDVVAVQEASISRRAGATAVLIADALGFALRYAPANPSLFPPAVAERLPDRAVDLANGFVRRALDFEEGPAILTRLPIVAHGAHPLPRPRFALENRVALRVRLETDGGPLDVWSVHLTRAGGGHARQARALAAIVLREAAGAPVAVLGDFNADAEASGMKGFHRARLQDAYRIAHPSTAGPTAWQRLGASRSTVSRRVDHCFLTAQGPLRVQRCDVVFDRPGTCKKGRPLWPSDHRGLLVDLAPW